MQDAWLEEYLSGVKDQVAEVERLVKSEQQKIQRAQYRMAKIREGFEAGLYNVAEAKGRSAGCRDEIGAAEQEIGRIWGQAHRYHASAIDGNTIRQELRQLATKNLEEALFEDKRDILNKLDIKVYPSEDLKTMRVKCGLKLKIESEEYCHVAEDGCGIVMFGLPVIPSPEKASQPVLYTVGCICPSSRLPRPFCLG
jgi:hypothetical protein